MKPKRDRDEPVDFLSRPRIYGESYANMMLTGIESILELWGGITLLRPLRMMGTRGNVKIGEKGEILVGYCDGITILTGYDADEKKIASKQQFWAKIYTHRKEWDSVPIVKTLKDFFNMYDLDQVNEFRETHNT